MQHTWISWLAASASLAVLTACGASHDADSPPPDAQAADCVTTSTMPTPVPPTNEPTATSVELSGRAESAPLADGSRYIVSLEGAQFSANEPSCPQTDFTVSARVGVWDDSGNANQTCTLTQRDGPSTTVNLAPYHNATSIELDPDVPAVLQTISLTVDGSAEGTYTVDCAGNGAELHGSFTIG